MSMERLSLKGKTGPGRIWTSQEADMAGSKATVWMDLEGITLSEIGPTEKDKYYMISTACGI